MDKHKQPSTRSNQNFVAIIAIVLGVAMLLKNIEILPRNIYSLLFSWKSFLIILGGWLVYRKNNLPGFILIAIGVVFTIPKLNLLLPPELQLYLNFRIIWPLAIIAVGIYLFVSNKNSQTVNGAYNATDTPPNQHENGSTDYQENSTNNGSGSVVARDCVFSSCFEFIDRKDLSAGTFTASFGDMVIDLSDAELLNNQAVLHVKSTFSNVKVMIPKHWVVTITTQNTFGSFSDFRIDKNTSTDNSNPKLFLNCASTFGGIKVFNC